MAGSHVNENALYVDNTSNNQRLGSALVMMSSAPAKYAGDARYASQDPVIRWLSHTISTPNAIRSTFFLTQLIIIPKNSCMLHYLFHVFLQAVESKFMEFSFAEKHLLPSVPTFLAGSCFLGIAIAAVISRLW